MHDVIVAGAGPAGSRCARLLEEQGLDVVVLERKHLIGLPVQCSGLISRNLDRFIRVPRDCIEHEVSGAVVHGPGGVDIELRKPSSAAYVLDRAALDRHLASMVESPVHLETGVTGVRVTGSSVSVSTSRGAFRARALVGADGPSSTVRRHFGAKPPETAQGLIAMVRERDSSDSVELWLRRDVCDGFLWRIPRVDRVEYGMLGTGVKFPELARFFRLKGFERSAGIIPMGGCRSFFPRTLLAGDAAAQTKPWSGGGVIYGLTAAGLAADTLGRCLRENDLSEDRLSAYEEAWKAEFGQQISMGMMGRALYRDLSEDQLAEIFRKLASQDLNSLDMDFPIFGF